jgi:hypothetical protein
MAPVLPVAILLTTILTLSNALPINNQQPVVYVKQVIAVESVIVDAQGNRVAVQQSLIDADNGAPLPSPADSVSAAKPEKVVAVQAEQSALLQATLNSVFEGLMGPEDKRYQTMRRVAELAIIRGAKVLVETGTARNGAGNCGGDGCSTVIFGKLIQLIAKLNERAAPLLFTVDINPQAIHESRHAASIVSSRISYHAIDSVRFLESFAQPIDVLYLDSFDFNGSDPRPSQRHHLKEILAAFDKLGSESVVIVDDCGLSDMGKCKLVDEHLKYSGWRVDMEGYQRVYVKS